VNIINAHIQVHILHGTNEDRSVPGWFVSMTVWVKAFIDGPPVGVLESQSDWTVTIVVESQQNNKANVHQDDSKEDTGQFWLWCGVDKIWIA
jgi:hypothetical protein